MIAVAGVLWTVFPYAAVVWLIVDLARAGRSRGSRWLVHAIQFRRLRVPISIAGAGVLVASAPFVGRGELGAVAEIAVVAATPFLARGWARQRLAGLDERRILAHGLTFGLGVLAAVSAAQWIAAAFDGTGATRPQGWLAHPNAWGSAVLVPVLVAILLRPSVPTVLAAGLSGSVVVALSGSRAAALAVVLGVIVAIPWMRTRTRFFVLATMALGAALLVYQDNAVVLRFAGGTSDSTNLVGSSEDLHAPEWSAVGVRVRSRALDGLVGTIPRRWTIEKTGDPWWARHQQTVRLEPSKVYTIMVELAAEHDDTEPGLHGIASEPVFASLTVAARGSWSDPSWEATGGGAVEDVSVASEDLGGRWRRLEVTLRVGGSDVVPLRLGIVPDARSGSGSRVHMRGYAVMEGAANTYAPTFRGGVDARASRGTLRGRVSYLQSAWSGFLASPWVGHGADAFADFDAGAARGYRVDHAHNIVLHALFRAGIVGAFGFVMLGLAMAALAPGAMAPLVAAVVAANMLDISFVTPYVGLSFAIALGILAGVRDSDRTKDSRSES